MNTIGLLPKPDLTIYLVAPIDILQERLRYRDGMCDTNRVEFNRRAEEAGQQAIHITMAGTFRCTTIDASAPQEEVLREAVAACIETLNGVLNIPFREVIPSR